MNAVQLLAHYEQIADAPDAIPRLRRFILDLAVRGKLVEQNPADEPASELLERIAEEKARLVKAGEAKKAKPLPPVDEDADFDVPATWCWTRLGVITSYIQRGKSPKYAVSDGATVVSQKCVQWSGLDLTVAKQVTFESLEKYEDIRFLRDGDLLWNSTGTGTIGRIIRLVDLPKKKLVCDSHVTVVRCLEVDSEYIRTWLCSDHVFTLIEGRAAGSTNQVELTAQMANNQVIPLPPLAEQHRIAAKVDELMALCDQLEAKRVQREATRDRLAAASLARLNAPDPDPETFQTHAAFALDNLASLTTRPDQIKALRQTILNLAVRGKLVEQDPADEPASELLKKIAAEKARRVKAGTLRAQKSLLPIAIDEVEFELATGWHLVRMSEVIKLWNGFGFKSGDFQSEGVPVIRIGNLQNGEVTLSGVKCVSEDIAQSVATEIWIPPDALLIAMSGATTGKTAFNRTGNQLLLNQRVGRIEVFFMSVDFLRFFFETIIAKNLSISFGTAIPNLSAVQINETIIPLPPLAEQHRIVAKVDELMGLCDRLEATLATTDTTRQRLLEALLHDALEPAANVETEAAE